MTGQGTYVLGIEPSNCRNLLGRVVARDAGELPILRAGESVHYRIEFRVRRTPSGRERLKPEVSPRGDGGASAVVRGPAPESWSRFHKQA